MFNRLRFDPKGPFTRAQYDAILKKIGALGLNKKGLIATPLKYGMLYGAQAIVDTVTMAANVTTVAGSSQFVTPDGSGNMILTVASSTNVFGHLYAAPVPNTGSATTAADKFSVNIATDTVYIVKINSGTYARSNRGKLCDLVVSANLQGAAVQVSTRGHLRILDGDETNNVYLIAQINPTCLTAGNAS